MKSRRPTLASSSTPRPGRNCGRGAGGVHLDEQAGLRPDDVEVRVRLRVLHVSEIEHRLPGADPHRNGRDRLAERPPRDRPFAHELREGDRQRDARSGDRGAARPAVRLEDVAVEGDGPLAEPAQLDDAAEGPPDEPLDFVRASALATGRRFARRAGVRRTREHAVLRRDPAAAGSLQERRHAIFDGGDTEDARVAERDQRRALRVPDGVGVD
jgi:hypothetical protein